MNNLGIGTDIEENIRFEKYSKDKSSRFLKRIFTDCELDYCFSYKHPASHLASIYAAKEATVKAMNLLTAKNIDYNNIEIIHSQKGAPIVNLKQNKFNKLNIHVSLSHTKNISIAFVLINSI